MVAATQKSSVDLTLVQVLAFHAGSNELSISEICESYQKMGGDMARFLKFLNDLTAIYYFLSYNELPWSYLDPAAQLGNYNWHIRQQRWNSCCDVLREQGLRRRTPNKLPTIRMVVVGALIAVSGLLLFFLR